MRVNSTLYFILKDHLGSASVVTDSTGTIVGEDRFYPYGETRFTLRLRSGQAPGTMQTDKLFTGQRAMRRPEPVEGAGLGIYDYGARFYSPKLGRFLNADTIVPGYANPQNLNGYAYVLNNPLRYIDPTGHKCVSVGPGDCLNDKGKPINGAGGLIPPKKKPKGGVSDLGGVSGSAGNVPGHEYTNINNEPNQVCLDWSWINCTEDEVADYMSRWQYPGQWPGSPVEDRHTYDVWPAKLFGIPNPVLWLLGMGDSGAIRVRVDDPLTITNVSEPTHVFHKGYVRREAFLGADGNWYISTYGAGTNDGLDINVPIFNVRVTVPGSGPVIDYINEKTGPYAFEAVDAGLLTYTTIVETGQYISSLIP